jgi:hypothetical protein
LRKLLFLFLVCIAGPVFAQPQEKEVSGRNKNISDLSVKNFIYAQGGYCLIGYNGSVNYERQLFRLGKNRSAAVTMRAGYGKWLFWTGGGPGGILSANMVFFKKASHLEGGFGAGALYDRKFYEQMVEQYRHFNGEPPLPKHECMIYTPVINLGYRYQNPTGEFIFRVGMCYPEGAYTGIGVAF